MRAAFVPTSDREELFAYFLNGCRVLRVNYDGLTDTNYEFGDQFTALRALSALLEEDHHKLGADFAIENSDDFDIEGI